MALFLSGIVHELGHALAAVVEGLPVEGFGVFVTLLFYPGAWVNLQSSYFENLSIFATLRVVCAGVWHNFTLAFIAYLLLQPTIGPLVAAPLYEQVTDGVIVAYMDGDVYTDILPNAKITQINECKVNSFSTWVGCFSQMQYYNFSSLSYCGSKEIAEKKSGGSLDCCQASYSGPSMCWEISKSSQSDQSNDRICYSAHALASDSYCPTSNTSRISENFEEYMKQFPNYHTLCPPNENCYTPIIPYPQILAKITMEIPGSPDTIHSSLSAGHPIHLYESIYVSEYRVRYPWLRSIIPPYCPSMVEKFLTYTCSLSGALAILNIAPMYLLDGEHACKKVLQYLLQFRGTTIRNRGVVAFWAATIFKLTVALFLSNLVVSIVAVTRTV